MNIIRKSIILITIALLLMPTLSLAKAGIKLEQEVVSIQSQDNEGALLTVEGISYTINDEELQLKAAPFVGTQARVLYFKMVDTNICVDIVPITAPPFVITAPTVDHTVRPL